MMKFLYKLFSKSAGIYVHSAIALVFFYKLSTLNNDSEDRKPHILLQIYNGFKQDFAKICETTLIKPKLRC